VVARTGRRAVLLLILALVIGYGPASPQPIAPVRPGPTVAAGLAPRELVFLRAMPAGFAETEALLKRTFIDFQSTQEFLKRPIIFHRAEGLYLWDTDGKRYFDAIGGVFVATLGLLFWVPEAILYMGWTRFWITLLAEVFIWGLFAVAFNLLMGYTGMISFGQAAYLGIGGYTTGLLLKKISGFPFALGLMAAPVSGALAALIIGYFCIRLTHTYFAMLTLAFSMIVYYTAFKWYDFTGGDNGLIGVPVPTWVQDPTFANYYKFVLVVTLVGVYLLWRIVNSPFGKTLTAIRENPDRAGFVGVDVKRYQLYAFIVAGAFSGLAGALFAGAVVLIGLGPGPVVILACVVAAGVGWAFVYVEALTLAQRLAGDDVMSRVFGVMESTMMASQALGALAVPVLIALVGVMPAIVVSGLTLGVVVAAAAPTLIRADRLVPSRVRQLKALRAVPMFGPLSAPVLERLATSATTVRVGAGDAIITAGEIGDRFYVVMDGEVEVRTPQGGRRRLQTGDAFGEIALLRDIPRTATVSAIVPTELLALDRGPFLEALTGQPRSRSLADAETTRRLDADVALAVPPGDSA
jgi:ABC-type branched-subunit amino acid transport system permease subunit